MKLIVISPPETLPGEIDFVNTLFKQGLTKFHLRKPNVPSTELIQYLQKIDPEYISNVVVHYDFEMLRHFPQVGFHFNQYSLSLLSYKGFTHKSYSAHSFREILGLNAEAFDYIFISPVFESISKPGYYSGFLLLSHPQDDGSAFPNCPQVLQGEPEFWDVWKIPYPHLPILQHDMPRASPQA